MATRKPVVISAELHERVSNRSALTGEPLKISSVVETAISFHLDTLPKVIKAVINAEPSPLRDELAGILEIEEWLDL